jgi:hypothetical protein
MVGEPRAVGRFTASTTLKATIGEPGIPLGTRRNHGRHPTRDPPAAVPTVNFVWKTEPQVRKVSHAELSPRRKMQTDRRRQLKLNPFQRLQSGEPTSHTERAGE